MFVIRVETHAKESRAIFLSTLYCVKPQQYVGERALSYRTRRPPWSTSRDMVINISACYMVYRHIQSTINGFCGMWYFSLGAITGIQEITCKFSFFLFVAGKRFHLSHIRSRRGILFVSVKHGIVSHLPFCSNTSFWGKEEFLPRYATACYVPNML